MNDARASFVTWTLSLRHVLITRLTHASGGSKSGVFDSEDIDLPISRGLMLIYYTRTFVRKTQILPILKFLRSKSNFRRLKTRVINIINQYYIIAYILDSYIKNKKLIQKCYYGDMQSEWNSKVKTPLLLMISIVELG